MVINLATRLTPERSQNCKVISFSQHIGLTILFAYEIGSVPQLNIHSHFFSQLLKKKKIRVVTLARFTLSYMNLMSYNPAMITGFELPNLQISVCSNSYDN